MHECNSSLCDMDSIDHILHLFISCRNLFPVIWNPSTICGIFAHWNDLYNAPKMPCLVHQQLFEFEFSQFCVRSYLKQHMIK
jgi:hypothetical protein